MWNVDFHVLYDSAMSFCLVNEKTFNWVAKQLLTVSPICTLFYVCNHKSK